MKSEYTANLALALQPKPVVSHWEQSAYDLSHNAKLEARKDDLRAANRSNNRFLKSAAFKALNNLAK